MHHKNLNLCLKLYLKSSIQGGNFRSKIRIDSSKHYYPIAISLYYLKFSNQESYNYHRYSSYISGPIWLDNLNQCSSSSTDLRSCTNAVGVHDCTHSEDIVLTCKLYVCTLILTDFISALSPEVIMVAVMV